jgi:hypothetical protein
MHTKEPREDPLVEMGYEIRDVDFPKLRTAALCFFGFTGFCAIVGSILYANRFTVFGLAKPETGNTVMYRPVPGAQYPLLQDNITSKTDISVLREQETVRLTGTGYNVDRTTVHIPVDRAMDIIVQRGLPDIKSSVPAVIKGNTTTQNGTPVPATSASGQDVPQNLSAGAKPLTTPPVGMTATAPSTPPASKPKH